jgi:hypothetical protein
MSDHTAEFFEELGRRGHERRLGAASGTLRFDLERDDSVDRWFLTIRHGDVEVHRDDRPADSVLRTNRVLFDKLVTGRANAYAAWTRHEMTIEGDPLIARLFQWFLPGPPGARHPRDLAPDRGRRT